MEYTVIIHNRASITVKVEGERLGMPAEVALIAAGLGYFLITSTAFWSSHTHYYFSR